MCKKTKEILVFSEEQPLHVEHKLCNDLRKRRAVSQDLCLLVMQWSMELKNLHFLRVDR